MTLFFIIIFIDNVTGQMPVAAGQETGELGELRAQLLKFLNESAHYRAEKLIRTFPYECE